MRDEEISSTTPALARHPPANYTEAAGVWRLEGAQAPSLKPRLTILPEGNRMTHSLTPTRYAG